MIKRIIKDWEEQDAYTSRGIYAYLEKAGVVKAIKKRTHRRERREATREMNAQLRDYPLED